MTSHSEREKKNLFGALRLSSAHRSKSGRLYEIEGQFYRMRRGQLVLVPAEWLGKTADRWPRKRMGMHDWPQKLKKMYTARKGHRYMKEVLSMKRTGVPYRIRHGQEDL